MNEDQLGPLRSGKGQVCFRRRVIHIYKKMHYNTVLTVEQVCTWRSCDSEVESCITVHCDASMEHPHTHLDKQANCQLI
jgi:hypothetical protein